MKNASSYLSKYLPKSEDVMITIISAQGKNTYLDLPKRSLEIVCPNCNSSDFGATFMESPNVYMWFCSKKECLDMNLKSRSNEPKSLKRALDWIDFCNQSDLGDLYHSVTFESIDQKQKYLDFFKAFAFKPSNIVIFSGDTDSGKTYASLGICELFTRTYSSCCFMTFETLERRWISASKEASKIHLFDKLTTVRLLVLDDFGQRQPPPGFMQFIFDIISNRIGWSDKGTIITTNLSTTGIYNYSGEALSNRMQAGTVMPFTAAGRTKNRKSSWNVFK